MVSARRKGHKKEGQVVEILERKKNNFVGVLELSQNFGFVIPDSDNMPYDIFIPKSGVKDVKNGLDESLGFFIQSHLPL